MMKNLRALILHTLLLLCVVSQATAVTQTLGDPVAARSAEALEQYREGNFEEALRIYRDALVQRPGSPSLHLNVGDALYELGDYAAAVDEFERAAGAPDEGLAAQGYYNLGNSHFQQQDFSAAAEAYREALQRTPQDQDTKANLELALQMLQSPPPQQQQGDGEQNEDEQESGEQQQQEQSDAGDPSDPQDPNGQSQDPQSEDQQPQNGPPEQESPPEPSQPDDSQESESEPDQQAQDEAELDTDERMDEQEAEQLLDALGDREEEGQKRRFRVSRRGSQERDW
jgi:Ca-activated chloride channel family protein